MPSFVFTLPDDAEVIGRLIQAVPDSWSWLDGVLYVPRRLVDEEHALTETGYILSRFRGVRTELAGKLIPNDGTRKAQRPDLFGFLVERKYPGWLRFDEAGYNDHDELPLATAKRLAEGYVKLGYRGLLRFYSDCRDNNKYHNPARFYLEMSPGDCLVGTGFAATGIALVSWEKAHGGMQQDVAHVLELCRSLDLKDATSVAR
jgi:hypothetical protein